jgi:hypothetical protein
MCVARGYPLPQMAKWGPSGAGRSLSRALKGGGGRGGVQSNVGISNLGGGGREGGGGGGGGPGPPPSAAGALLRRRRRIVRGLIRLHDLRVRIVRFGLLLPLVPALLWSQGCIQ